MTNYKCSYYAGVIGPIVEIFRVFGPRSMYGPPW